MLITSKPLMEADTQDLEELKSLIVGELERRKCERNAKLQAAFIEAFNACLDNGISIYVAEGGFQEIATTDGCYSIDLR